MFRELDVIPPAEAFDGPMQMALDEILLADVLCPTLRLYRWTSPWITFGYFQKLEAVTAQWPGIPVVRRWTGGGMVRHGEDLTFSLVIPTGEPAADLTPSEFYNRLHSFVARAVAPVLGSGVRLVGREDVCAGEVCFNAPALDDLIRDGRKLLGGAQRRRGGALLYQGSLQDPSAGKIDPLCLATGLAREVMVLSDLPAGIVSLARNLAAEKYGSDAWNGRR
jgi:lipoate-protein ligase A